MRQPDHTVGPLELAHVLFMDIVSYSLLPMDYQSEVIQQLHEFWHILLGPNAHFIVGIMRGTLLPEDWEKAEQGTLGFTHSLNQQIRWWITQRSRR